jgi:hypothetical protein
MPIDSKDAFVAKGGYQYDSFAIPGGEPPPIYGYVAQTPGENPRFQIGGSFHGFYYGVVGSGGYAWYEGEKVGPEVNLAPPRALARQQIGVPDRCPGPGRRAAHAPESGGWRCFTPIQVLIPWQL